MSSIYIVLKNFRKVHPRIFICSAVGITLLLLLLILNILNRNYIEFQVSTDSISRIERQTESGKEIIFDKTDSSEGSETSSEETELPETIVLQDKDVITCEYGSGFDGSQISVLYKGTIFRRSGQKLDISYQFFQDAGDLGSYINELSVEHNKALSDITVTVNVVDTTPPEITLVSDPDHYTSPIASYEEEGYTAADLYDGDLTDQVVSEEKDGYVYYSVSDSSGNTAEEVREIIYKDTVPPVIELTDGAEINVQIGTDFTDPGYTAADDCDGDITDRVAVEGTVDGHTEGDYTLHYSVKDSYDNEFTIDRIVHVKDTLPPVITLTGNKSVYVPIGTTYSDPGYSAVDEKDGDVTANVTVSGSVNTSAAGTYTVTYSVTDQAGNTANETRTVYVYQKAESTGTNSANPPDPGSKVIYLTFDDGPGPYTQQLLDVLDKYNVKATFFVTNANPKYQSMIAEEARRGHTVGIHTYTHDYAKIYASDDAYIADMNSMNEVIRAQTGRYASIFRFPGGSSNAVSKKYNTGIMTRLTASLTAQGYQYYDWNVSSGDAGGTTSTAQVVSNVTSGCAKNNISVVLQHDVKSFSVNAVEEIIQWGLANGYTFRAIDSSTPVTHHSVNN